MSETLTLPVLPLDDDVVLPGMVVPIELSDTEVRGAIDAARNRGAWAGARHPFRREAHRCCWSRGSASAGLAAVGTLAVVEQVGRLPGGEPGAVLRGVSRVKIGSRDDRAGRGAVGRGHRDRGDRARVPGATELAKEYKALVIAMLQKRGAWQVVDMIQQLDDPSAIADRAGYASYLTAEQKLTLLETADLVERLELAIRWTREHLAELDVAETIRKDVTEGMEKQQKEFLLRQQLAAVRKELNELTGGGKDTEEDDYRARVEAADLPENVREAALKEVDKLERTPDASPETGWIRTWLDTILDIPWNERTEDAYDIAGARRDPRRGPHRARRREGADRRVPGGAQAAQRPGPRRHRRPPLRRRARPGRPARRRQDVARRVGRPGDGPQVRPGRARRRPGRGGDPRSPAHLRRRAARPRSSGPSARRAR